MDYNPTSSVSVGAATGDETVFANYHDAKARFFLDVNVTAASPPQSGTVSVYVWGEAEAAELLVATQAFATGTSRVYRFEIAGRPFFIKHVSGTNITYSYTLI